VSTCRMSYNGCQHVVKMSRGRSGWTYDLVDHDQDPGLRMLATLHISKDHETQPVLDETVYGTVNAGRVDVHRARVQQEDVGFGAVRNVVHMSQNVGAYAFGVGDHDKGRVHVDGSRALSRVSGVLCSACLQPRVPTKVMGVSFNIFARILYTRSESPERQTFVTRVFSGPRCMPGTGLGLADVTVAWIWALLASVMTLHRDRRLSTLRAWTGSSWFGGGESGLFG
jgi:hypothetical protein